MRVASDEELERRLGARLGPTTRALFALLRVHEGDPETAFGVLGPGRRLMFDILWSPPSAIAKRTRLRVPFATDHKRTLWLRVVEGARSVDDFPVVDEDWGEGKCPTVVAASVRHWLSQLAYARPPTDLDPGRVKAAQGALRRLPGVSRARAAQKLPLSIRLLEP